MARVMSARMIPGFCLASVGGVLVDRWDRRKVMVTCDVGRGLVLATLPFVDSVWQLFLASLALEVLTLLWSPAKEASVPNLVPSEKLASANSFSLAAAYGTFPIASALFASLTKVSEIIGRHAGPLDFLRLNQESLAIYFDVCTFLLSATLIWSLTLPRNRPAARAPIDLTRTFTEIKEGWKFIGTNPTVRSVMVGLGTGLIGGGMVAPLGPIYANQVLHAGPAGFGLLLTALGMGLAVGVVGLSTRLGYSERHLNRLITDELGAGPLAIARAQRAQTARVLIETTDMPMTDIAFAAGFASVRQFNDTVRDVFATSPSDLRQQRRRRESRGRRGQPVGDESAPGSITLRLPVRPPFDAASVFAFLGARVVPGIESWDGRVYRRSLRLPNGAGVVALQPVDGAVSCTLWLDALADL
ncbi:MAG: MFS transporter, partial [Acidimicrobiales bacterium]|nr:MFS transporter [Acidimicrobiales bacterium]